MDNQEEPSQAIKLSKIIFTIVVLIFAAAGTIIRLLPIVFPQNYVSKEYTTLVAETSNLMAQEKYSEVLMSGEKLLELSKSDQEKAGAHALLAVAYIKLGKIDDAEIHINKSKSIDPTYEKLDDLFAALYFAKTKSLWLNGKYEQVADSATQALSYLQNDEQKGYVHYLLSVAFLNLNQPRKASVEERTATQLDPSTTTLIYNDSIQKTKSLWSDGKYDDMLAPANKALDYARSDEEKGYAHYWLGIYYFRLNQLDQAEAEEKLALGFIPESAAPNVTMAAIYMDRNNPEDALGYSQKAAELQPDYAWAYNSLGLVLADLGRKEEAIKALEKAVQLDPNTSVFRLNLRVVSS